MAACTGGSLALPHGICLCNPFLKRYAVLLDPQHLLKKVMSFVCSTDFCHFFPQPAVLQFGDLLILPQFLRLTSKFFVCSPTLAMYHCQKHVQGQVLWYRCDCIISPDKSFLKFLQDWDPRKDCHETLRPYGLVPLHSSLCIHLFLSCRRL